MAKDKKIDNAVNKVIMQSGFSKLQISRITDIPYSTLIRYCDGSARPDYVRFLRLLKECGWHFKMWKDKDKITDDDI